MKIRINKVEGETGRKGIKQNREYILTLAHPESPKHQNWYIGTNDKGKRMSIWNVKGDWSEIGISQIGRMRYTYTKDFELIQDAPGANPGNPCQVVYNGQLVEALNFGRVI